MGRRDAAHTPARIMRALIPAIAFFLIAVLAAVLLATSTPSSDGLIGTTWEWTASTTARGAEPSPVPDPSRYTVKFSSDRTFQAQADCNTVSGTFRRVPPGRVSPLTSLSITPGPSTLVACGQDSLSDAYVLGLDAAASYAIVSGVLTINLATGGSMTFR